MKKLISILVLVSVLAGCFCITSGAEYISYTPGDVNGDGEINSIDSITLKKYAAGIECNVDEKSADVSGDNYVNAKDLLVLKKHLAGVRTLEELFPEGNGAVGRIVIGKTDIAEYTIVVTNPENENMVFAAEELQKYVEMASEATLSIAQGESNAERQIVLLEDEVGTLGNDGFSITVCDGELTIMGGALRGTMYGVYELIEEYIGYRFYGYYDCDLWKADTVEIPEGLTDVQIPDSTYRNNSITPFHNEYTYNSVVKRKLSGSTTASSLNQAKYGYGISRTLCNAHSLDYFANSGDFITGEQYGTYVYKHCLTDFTIYEDDWDEDGIVDYKSTYQMCLENMCALLDERIASGQKIGKEITEISCSYAPFTDYCVCMNCRKIYREEKTHAGVLVDFVNRIDDELDARYPGITVITNAYGDVRIPPKTRSLNNDIILLYCWNGCVNHTIESCSCSSDGVTNVVGGNSVLGSNTVEQEYYLGWIEHCSQTYIWYYPTNIYYSLATLSNTFNIYHDMQWFMEHKAVGFYVVGTANDAFDGLNAYLISEMMWDKDITEEEYNAMIAEYLEFYYGAGWQNIYDILRHLEAAGDSMGCYMTEFSHPMKMYSREYLIEHFDEMKALLYAALGAAEDEWQQENIMGVYATVSFLGLNSTYQTQYVDGTDAQQSAYAAEYEAWYDYVNEAGVRVTYQQTGISEEFDLEKSPCELVYGFDD